MWGYWSLSIRNHWPKLLLPALVGLVLVVLGIGWTQVSDPLAEDSEIARATVINQEYKNGELLVEYRYETHDGSWLPGRDKLDGSLAETVFKAKVFEVIYDPKHPATHRILAKSDVQATRFLKWGLFLGGGLLLLVAAFFAVQILQENLKRGRLLQDGREAKSEVREWKTAGPHASKGQFTYAYQGPDGRWFEGTSIMLPMSMLAKFPVGRTLRVAFDPMQPKQSEPDIFGLRNA